MSNGNATFKYEDLKARCIAPFEDFIPLGQLNETKEGRHIFIDNGASILAVAHLDVTKDNGLYLDFSIAQLSDTGPVVFSRALDDRLGVYTVLDLLPQTGIKYDILLTENEEIGHSTAIDFVTEKQYNWMFMFDRAGDDVVMYSYDTPENSKLVRDSGAKVGHGSYSCIADLTFLKCAGFNWGVGYERNHSEWSHVPIRVYLKQVNLFLKFHETNKDTYIPHDPEKKRGTRSSVHYPSSVSSYRESEYSYINGFYRPSPSSAYKQEPLIRSVIEPLDGYSECIQCGLLVNDFFFLNGSPTCIHCTDDIQVIWAECPECKMKRRENGFSCNYICIECERALQRLSANPPVGALAKGESKKQRKKREKLERIRAQKKRKI